MEDYKIIIYILAAVAYFLFSQWRKAFNTPSEEEKPARKVVKREQPSKPATSFEDILRELQPKVEKAKTVAGQAEREVTQNLPPVNVPEPVVERKYKSYEDLTPKVLSWEKAAEAKEAQKRSQEIRQASFKAYAKEKESAKTKYAKQLKNPASVRDAIILSEILKRKYD